MDPIHPLVQSYSDKFTTDPESLLGEVDRVTADHPKAHMISGKVQGTFLQMLSTLMKPRRILEIGTFTGYSALCLAKGLAEDGELHTIELREDDAASASRYFKVSDRAEQIILHLGNALEIIPELKEAWDLVFIDADKPGYIDYYKLVLPNLRQGGIILADNVLFHGEVLDEGRKGKNAMAIQAFNDFVQQDATVNHVLLTIRDGLMMIQKK
ncbi:MAG: O-methyltransferase [Chitinophagaceae bacterium]|nr:O-methyltransferase [Chitinophagaceae bacterium]